VERPIYGAKRLGELKQEIDLTTPANPSIPPFTIGKRQYELTDHLGNVMSTILDRRQPYSTGNDAYRPYIVSTTDYYPFGYPISNRSTNIGEYRYFFNGQEADNEVFGEVANFTAEFWQYDSRLGRRWNVDPIFKAPESPYACFGGGPIWRIDKKGLKAGWVKDNDGNVFWDKNTNSQEEFERNYKNKTGFRYVSDENNAQSYTLPTGEGKLIMNKWEGADIVQDGQASVLIDMTFVPNEKTEKGGWMQTYSSNIPYVDSGNLPQVLPQSNIPSERLDGTGVVGKEDYKRASYFNKPPSMNLADMPIRKFNDGAIYSVSMQMQSSLILNNQKVISIGWGFIITGEKTATTLSPTILKTNTEFHNNAINVLLGN